MNTLTATAAAANQPIGPGLLGTAEDIYRKLYELQMQQRRQIGVMSDTHRTPAGAETRQQTDKKECSPQCVNDFLSGALGIIEAMEKNTVELNRLLGG